MYKITKNHLIGYSLMIAGIVVCAVNYVINCEQDANFGYLPLYIFSGLISASGLTIVFREKVEGKVEDVETNNS
jgi:hypothetical protein